VRALPSFDSLFQLQPEFRTSAPGRVNLIGEHTDYNGGFVLPTAIRQTTRVEMAPTDGRTVRVWSAAYPDRPPIEYELGREAKEGTWVDYVKGMTVVLAPLGLTKGFSARIESEVPVGSGLSSSAALEISVGRAIRSAYKLPLSDVDLARAARRAENEFVGAPVGIMDQMACSLATLTSALFLDTRSLEFEHVAIPDDAAVIVIDSGIEHRHADGGYKQRRRECEEAAAALGVRELRDADEETVARARLPGVLARRARHVVTENRRVLQTVDALRAGNLSRAGELFVQSHVSMRDDFEVSVPEIDALVDAAVRVNGIYGARMTGGGFGGAVVALAVRTRARAAADEVVRGYARTTGHTAAVVMAGAAADNSGIDGAPADNG
jgi:galactokinase